MCVSPTSLVCWLSLLPAGRTLQLSTSRGRHSQEAEGTCPVPAASLPGQAHHQHQLRGSGLAPVLPMRTHVESPLGTESSPPPPPPWCSHCLGLSEGTNHPGRLLPTAESLWSVGSSPTENSFGCEASTTPLPCYLSGKSDITVGPSSYMLVPDGGRIPSCLPSLDEITRAKAPAPTSL